MVYNFKLKIDRLDSKASANIQLPAIIQFLNEAQLTVCKKRYGGLNTNYKAAFEEIEKRRQEFQKLIVPREELDTKEQTKFIYIADITKTKEKFMFPLRTSFIGSKGACTDRKLKGMLTQTDDLDLVEDSPLDKSSFEWGEVIYRTVNDTIEVQSDGTFKIKKAVVDYLRYPKKMDMAGYKHFNGDQSADVDCELPEFILPDIVDEAKLIYVTSLQKDMQTTAAKMVNNE